MTEIKDTRSSPAWESMDELVHEEGAALATMTHAQQYQTPVDLCNRFNRKLLSDTGTMEGVAIDPQFAEGNTVAHFRDTCYNKVFGFEIDNRIADRAEGYYQHVIITGCSKAFEIFEDVFADDNHFDIANANPPFGKRWTINGKKIDSTEATWEFCTKHANRGWFIGNTVTLKRLGYDKHPWCYHYEEHENVWKDVEVVVGVVFWKRPLAEKKPCTNKYAMSDVWRKLSAMLEEERKGIPDYNVWLDHSGKIKAYLSTRHSAKLERKLKRHEILNLARLNDCHPLALTTDRETRKLLNELLTCGFYTISEQAEAAIRDALDQVAKISVPILPATDFESVAYADEEDYLLCVKDAKIGRAEFKAGQRYSISTATYNFVEKFTRTKVHFNESTMTTYSAVHECTRTGQDRYICVYDSSNVQARFMDKPRPSIAYEFDEGKLWEYFQRPEIKTLSDVAGDKVKKNLARMEDFEFFASFGYFPGQRDYIARLGVKDYALVAAAVGTGKTLVALTLYQLKHPQRGLIIAPQGTLRSSEADDDDDEGVEYNASQWVQEIRRFAPGIPVFELFSIDDYYRLKKANGGELPFGLFITYYQAFFQNQSRESVPETWKDEKLCEEAATMIKGFKCANTKAMKVAVCTDDTEPKKWCRSVGEEREGIRCIMQPTMSTLIGHEFDGVFVDEAHLCLPPSSMVQTTDGLVSIKEIHSTVHKKDWYALAFDQKENMVVAKRIVKAYENKLGKRKLVRIKHQRGSIICTEDHPLLADGIWKSANKIRRGDNLLELRTECCGGASLYEGDKEQKILFSKMLQSTHIEDDSSPERCSGKGVVKDSRRTKTLGFENCIGKEQDHESKDCCEQSVEGAQVSLDNGAKLEKQSDAKQEHCREDEKKEDWCRVSGTVIQNRRQDSGSENSGEVAEAMECRNGISNQLRSGGVEEVQRVETLVCCGHCDTEQEDRNRSGWSNAHKNLAEDSGHKEGNSASFSRVESVEILELGDYARYGVSSEEDQGVVYCLEVEDLNCFFADGVLVHNCKNMVANLTTQIIRLQPKFRYAFTATPISNVIADLFPLMGWLCVPGWYKGGIRNAAWPFAREEIGRFVATFQSTERDHTQEEQKRREDPTWRGKCERTSPVISSPARLLKLLKPTMAYISKEQCNPSYQPPKVIDVRVPMGTLQSKLYGHFLNRANISAKNPLVRARKQTAYLRNICADPAGFSHGGPVPPNNMNPKTFATMELIKEIIARQEQVVVISSRVGQTRTIAELLNEAGIPFARIDSTMAPAQHARSANIFKNGRRWIEDKDGVRVRNDRWCPVMLMGIKCAASYSFHLCENMIVGSLEWSFGTKEQAFGRVDRINSPKPPTIYCILAKDSIEELMHDCVGVKGDAATICLQGKRIPRDFKPVDAGEVLAAAIAVFNFTKTTGEEIIARQWPKLRDELNGLIVK